MPDFFSFKQKVKQTRFEYKCGKSWLDSTLMGQNRERKRTDTAGDLQLRCQTAWRCYNHAPRTQEETHDMNSKLDRCRPPSVGPGGPHEQRSWAWTKQTLDTVLQTSSSLSSAWDHLNSADVSLSTFLGKNTEITSQRWSSRHGFK